MDKQFLQWQETISFFCGILFHATGIIGNISTQKIQSIRYHPAGLSQSHDPDFQSGDFTSHPVPRFLTKPMQTTH